MARLSILSDPSALPGGHASKSTGVAHAFTRCPPLLPEEWAGGNKSTSSCVGTGSSKNTELFSRDHAAGTPATFERAGAFPVPPGAPYRASLICKTSTAQQLALGALHLDTASTLSSEDLSEPRPSQCIYSIL